MKYLESANELYLFLKELPLVGSFFADNTPYLMGIIGIWLLWLVLVRATPLGRLIRSINEDARGELVESDFIKFFSLQTRIRIYMLSIPFHLVVIVSLLLLMALCGTALFKSFFLEATEAKFSAIVVSGALTIFSGWLCNLQRLYLFQYSRFIQNRGNINT